MRVRFARIWRMLFAAAAIISAAPLRGADADGVHDPDLTERAYIAAAAYHAIKRYFAHAEGLPPGYDFETRYKAYLREALHAPDRHAFSLATMRLFASLRNGHTSFTDERIWEQTAPMPFRMEPVEGKWTVIASRLRELPPGDVIGEVDGHPISDWLTPLRELDGDSSAAGVDRSLWQLVPLVLSSFVVKTEDGRSVPVDLAARPAGVWRGRVLPDRTVATICGSVVVIRIPSFDGKRFEADAIAAIRKASTTQAILLDLRGNSGGNTPEQLLDAVMTEPYRGTVVATPLTVAEDDAHAVFSGGRHQLPTTMKRYGPERYDPRPDAWRGRMAVLADGGCGSACEDFVLRFRDGHRGPVLGEATRGSTGQPYHVWFTSLGMSFRVSTKREYLPDGQPFEGVGVRPDRPIPLTRAELRSGTDLQLAKAVAATLER